MVKVNYIDITGVVETLPKSSMIDGKLCCEFLLSSRAWMKSKSKKESFSIAVLLSRKNAKRCLEELQKGTEIRVQGNLSWNEEERKYNGFYIDVKKIIGLRAMHPAVGSF